MLCIKDALLAAVASISMLASSGALASGPYTFKAGDESLYQWLLPATPPHPKDNVPTKARVDLGKRLFFDPRLSGDRNMSCATCHNPSLGWSDALPKSKGVGSKTLPRATPTIINTAYNSIQMWDGREPTLESQAVGPIESPDEMNMDMQLLTSFLSANEEYVSLFEAAYPGEGVTAQTIGKALASFERTIVSRNSPFDRWVRGEKNALTKDQIAGFKLFVDPKKGNCEVCHSAPNFTDNGFHNLGLASFGGSDPDMGRYTQKPIGLMKGAFKTPTLRDITRSGPYFHDGSAVTLSAVVDHYIEGGVVKTNLSPNLTPANLSAQEAQQLVSFMEALSSPAALVSLPILPVNH